MAGTGGFGLTVTGAGSGVGEAAIADKLEPESAGVTGVIAGDAPTGRGDRVGLKPDVRSGTDSGDVALDRGGAGLVDALGRVVSSVEIRCGVLALAIIDEELGGLADILSGEDGCVAPSLDVLVVMPTLAAKRPS